MNFVIVLFTIVLILDCLLLGLLILIQLPKKEAGAGVAFGGGATDALFGAGSGTALTKLTKYTAIIFFALVLLLSILNSASRSSTSDFKKLLEKQQAAVPPQKPVPAASGNATAATNVTGIPLTITNSLPATTTTTNTPVAPAK
jgi:preprotein translocase subunit SecG